MKLVLNTIVALIWLASLLICTSLISHAKNNILSNRDGVYMEFLAESRYKVKKTAETTASTEDGTTNLKDDSAEEKKEEVNPTQVYKLIAVYLIGKQPRALMRNDLEPEDGPMEYRVGDYLDDGKTVSISRISLSPTTRVELIDKHGITYLMKPYTIDEINTRGGDRSTFSASPTYSTSTKRKSSSTSSTSKPPTTVPSSTSSSASSASPPPAPVDDAKKEDTSLKPTEAEPTTSPPPAEKASAESKPPEKASDGGNGTELDISRPSNPFED